MPTYKFTDSAKADLTAIVDYTVATWGSDQAVAYVAGLERLAASISNAPDIGKRCPDLHDELLAFPYQSHVIYYLPAKHGVTIARVLHESMNAALQFKKG